MIGKYRKRPIVIEAAQYSGTPDSALELIEWSGGIVAEGNQAGCLSIFTQEGMMTVSPGDWVIRGIAGEFYPCKPDIFSGTYYEVTSLSAPAR